MFIKDIFTASEVSYKKGYAVCSPMAKSFKGDDFFRHGHKYGQYLKILVGKRKASRLTSPHSPTACVCVCVRVHLWGEDCREPLSLKET